MEDTIANEILKEIKDLKVAINDTNERLDKIKKEKLSAIETKLDRIDTSYLPIIKASTNSIVEELQIEIPNIRLDISDVKNEGLSEIKKELTKYDIKMGELSYKQTIILKILESQLGIKSSLNLL